MERRVNVGDKQKPLEKMIVCWKSRKGTPIPKDSVYNPKESLT